MWNILSFKLFSGFIVLILLLLLCVIYKKWKVQRINSENKTLSGRFNGKTIAKLNQPKKPRENNDSKLYNWIQKITNKIPLLNAFKEKSQQFINKEETSTYFAKNNKSHTEVNKQGMLSYFKAEQTK